MTKEEFINELRKELKHHNIDEIEDIITEYEQHFEFRLEEGLTEEEITKKLSSPKEIAKEYEESVTSDNGSMKSMKKIGIIIISIPLTLVYLLMLLATLVLGIFSIACVITSVCLVLNVNIANLIPYMPYLISLILGISFLGLALASGIGTYYMFKYIIEWGKEYLKWCKGVINGYYVAIKGRPKISKGLSVKLNFFSIVGVVCFVSAFVAGYVLMIIVSKSFEPWHVWNWFV